jgi:hypothetical protein
MADRASGNGVGRPTCCSLGAEDQGAVGLARLTMSDGASYMREFLLKLR